MGLGRVQPRRDVHALLAMEWQTVLAFSLGQSDLVDVKPAYRLTHYLLLVIQVVRVDLLKLKVHWLFGCLLDQRRCSFFVCLQKLDLKLAHSFFHRFDRHFLHLSRRYLIFSQSLSICLLLQLLPLRGTLAARAVATTAEDLLLHDFLGYCLLLLLIDNYASAFLQQVRLAVLKIGN